MPTLTSVLIGSRPSVPATSVTVTADASTEVLSFPGGDFYLDHGTGSLSLLAAVATMFNTHSNLLGTGAVITRSGKTRLTNAMDFSVDSWGADTTLRDLLGFTAALLGMTVHVSPNHSPLYWSPGKPESTTGLQGSDGLLTKDTRAARSGPGVVVATTNNEWFRNAIRWRFVKVARMQTIPTTNGTWLTFWDEVISRYRRFFVARNVLEDPADDVTAISVSTRIPSTSVGAYILKQDGELVQEHQREIASLEAFNTVQLPVETAREYGT